MDYWQLMDLTRAYQQSALVMALAELDLATYLADFSEEGATAEELAEASKLHLRPLTALLGAAVSLGIFKCNFSGHFSNTPLSLECLVKGGKRYIGDQMQSYADQYKSWANLSRAVRDGMLILPSLHNDVKEDPALRNLIMGLHKGGLNVLPQLLPYLAPLLAQSRNLLDVGCGAGTFGIGFAENFPRLQATLFDQPSVLEISREVAAESAGIDRISFQPGDYRLDSLGKRQYDVILFFQVLRTETPEIIRKLLDKTAEALRPRGIVAIYDTLLEDNRTEPLENVFQNLTLALMYSGGGLFTKGDLNGWLLQAGFNSPQMYSIKGVRPMALYIAGLKN